LYCIHFSKQRISCQCNSCSNSSPLTSSSYAVFDSGYQYLYDRFNQQFVYIPCSGDVAGLCVRTDIEQFPWYSPAGSSRGTIKYAIKLAFNPDQNARDQLYSQRINPVISSPGSGIILFGDKTALSYQSAFDRINVRRLFITLEQAIKGAANAQLFEFNDATTRANFINIVEPYLRDVQIKRGITDFLLVCDETNNTPDVIDRNEFIADIYVKPARSINFIGLTFVATRTGVSFESIVGTV
jgi:phage tail sheath protein FI